MEGNRIYNLMWVKNERIFANNYECHPLTSIVCLPDVTEIVKDMAVKVVSFCGSKLLKTDLLVTLGFVFSCRYSKPFGSTGISSAF